MDGKDYGFLVINPDGRLMLLEITMPIVKLAQRAPAVSRYGNFTHFNAEREKALFEEREIADWEFKKWERQDAIKRGEYIAKNRIILGLYVILGIFSRIIEAVENKIYFWFKEIFACGAQNGFKELFWMFVLFLSYCLLVILFFASQVSEWTSVFFSYRGLMGCVLVFVLFGVLNISTKKAKNLSSDLGNCLIAALMIGDMALLFLWFCKWMQV